jgi:UDP-N-acetyl-D-mannosaminuronic acid transferase (WecB/TagA/CpsF family)
MKLLSLDIYQGTYLDFLTRSKNPNIRTLVFTPNPEILLKAYRDDDFYEVLKKADFLVPDAVGLYTVSLIKEGTPYLKALFMTFFKRKELEKKYGEVIQGSNLTKDLVANAIEG